MSKCGWSPRYMVLVSYVALHLWAFLWTLIQNNFQPLFIFLPLFVSYFFLYVFLCSCRISSWNDLNFSLLSFVKTSFTRETRAPFKTKFHISSFWTCRGAKQPHRHVCCYMCLLQRDSRVHIAVFICCRWKNCADWEETAGISCRTEHSKDDTQGKMHFLGNPRCGEHTNKAAEKRQIGHSCLEILD